MYIHFFNMFVNITTKKSCHRTNITREILTFSLLFKHTSCIYIYTTGHKFLELRNIKTRHRYKVTYYHPLLENITPRKKQTNFWICNTYSEPRCRLMSPFSLFFPLTSSCQQQSQSEVVHRPPDRRRGGGEKQSKLIEYFHMGRK